MCARAAELVSFQLQSRQRPDVIEHESLKLRTARGGRRSGGVRPRSPARVFFRFEIADWLVSRSLWSKKICSVRVCGILRPNFGRNDIDSETLRPGPAHHLPTCLALATCPSREPPSPPSPFLYSKMRTSFFFVIVLQEHTPPLEVVVVEEASGGEVWWEVMREMRRVSAWAAEVAPPSPPQPTPTPRRFTPTPTT